MSAISGSISYGKEEISFAVIYADRKTMEIAVYPDASVIVKAPRGTLLEVIRNRLAKRARWILKQLNHFRKFEPHTPARCYIGGETHLFLGRQYRLKIKNGNNNEVKLKGAYFHILTSEPGNPRKIEELLDGWYKEHARKVFAQRLEACYSRAKKMNVPLPRVRLRKMTRRWGSCSKKGDITLNSALVKAPLYCIDYVIIHELCHVKIHTHDNRYFRLLAKYMPDWEKRKERLEKVIA